MRRFLRVIFRSFSFENLKSEDFTYQVSIPVQPLGSSSLDDQGALRKHVAIFVNQELIRDRAKLSDAIADGDEIFVVQALSGG